MLLSDNHSHPELVYAYYPNAIQAFHGYDHWTLAIDLQKDFMYVDSLNGSTIDPSVLAKIATAFTTPSSPLREITVVRTHKRTAIECGVRVLALETAVVLGGLPPTVEAVSEIRFAPLHALYQHLMDRGQRNAAIPNPISIR